MHVPCGEDSQVESAQSYVIAYGTMVEKERVAERERQIERERVRERRHNKGWSLW